MYCLLLWLAVLNIVVSSLFTPVWIQIVSWAYRESYSLSVQAVMTSNNPPSVASSTTSSQSTSWRTRKCLMSPNFHWRSIPCKYTVKSRSCTIVPFCQMSSLPTINLGCAILGFRFPVLSAFWVTAKRLWKELSHRVTITSQSPS